jgi:YD repeat-containing protein
VLPHALIEASLDHDPPDIAPWTPGQPPPPELASVLGRWWSEGFEFVFRWRDGHLEARAADAPAARPPAVFRAETSADLLRTESGREAGEQLRLTRDESGRVVRMHWATYRFTRDQQTFDAT